MALYRLEAKIIGRTPKDKDGKAIPGRRVSIVAKAAYRSGQRLRDEQQDKAFNYRSRSQEVVHSEILTPEGAPAWMAADRGRLWNEVERCEKRKDSQLAREFVIALPVELSRERQIEAVRSWCQKEIVSNGFVADFALHRSKDGRNPHAHVLVTTRPIEGESFGKKPNTEGKFNGRAMVGKGAKDDLLTWRASWESHCNRSLEEAGRAERVDRRSLKDRGIERLPQPKIGVDATALERKGVATERARIWRWSRMDSLLLPARRTLRTLGEVGQVGTGGTWWQRAHTAIRVSGRGLGELLRDESGAARRPVAAPDIGYWQQQVTGPPAPRSPGRDRGYDLG